MRDVLSWKGRPAPLPVIPGEWLVSGDADDQTTLSALELALLPAFPADLAANVCAVARVLPPERMPLPLDQQTYGT
ncbi:hypothetical protein [Nocardia lijiangensis]|uniref:hypothetical protein n=1 Tax=Nocardia lijiangensis TaxID=299618 RepID=UPI00083547DF|nr:hypothetical protein [Nocardia lijiangensis]